MARLTGPLTDILKIVNTNDMATVVSQQKDKKRSETTFSGVWVKGSTLMTPTSASQETEESEAMDLAVYRMPHTTVNPDDPSRDFEHADKW